MYVPRSTLIAHRRACKLNLFIDSNKILTVVILVEAQPHKLDQVLKRQELLSNELILLCISDG